MTDQFAGFRQQQNLQEFRPFILLLLLSLMSGCQDSDRTRPSESKITSIEKAGHSSRNDLTADLKDLSSSLRLSATSTCRIRFQDVHDQAGIQFTFDNGYSPKKLMPHSTSGGAGWLDYDSDGWYDLFLPQGGSLEASQPEEQPHDELFRNLNGSFTSVTMAANIHDVEYGHGVAIGDFDDDGFDDIYVTNVGPDVLLQNMGDGTFKDITLSAGINSPRWGSSAAWGDVDRDGDLDLYVCNYLDYDPRHPIACVNDDGNPTTCNPKAMKDVPNEFYLNLGDGTFRECADDRGLNADGSKSLGIVIADLTDDGEPDIFVANDTTANHLFVNQGNGYFVENALALGCALGGLGQFQANMGVAFGDYDRNSLPDLYVTHFTLESNTLYQNLGPSGFTDVTNAVGLHTPTLPFLGFGTVMDDFDADGWQDVIVANGHIDDFRQSSGAMWKMRPQLFSFNGTHWTDCGNEAGEYFQKEWLGRAIASADYDHDGDFDLAIVHQNDPMALLRNDSPSGHWLQLAFVGRQSNRRGVCVKAVATQGNLKLVQQLAGGTSYCASHEPILHFGFGPSAAKCELQIQWPSGRQQLISSVDVDQKLVIRESEASVP